MSKPCYAKARSWTLAGSPLKHALTEYQCLQYALDKPGVLTTLPGVRNHEDLKRVLGFLKASPEEKDYSVLGTLAPQDAKGICESTLRHMRWFLID